MTNGQNPVKPYKGLVPYTEEDARFFFGREGEQEIISANLQAARLTIFYGASGVGKSSVLRAGVVRHLRGLAQKDLEAGGKPKFIALVFSAWQDDPIAALLKEVGNAVEQTTGTKLAARVASLSFSEQLRTWNKQVDAELLIVMDQFEDYFLYHPHDDEEGTFAYEFPLAVNRSDLRANFLLSLREEALGKLDRFKGRIIGLFDNYLRLEPLEKDAARSAIVKPIDAYNSLQSAVEHQADIEQELVEEVLRQVVVGKVFVGDIGRGVVSGKGRKDRIGTYIETPYLQLVMTRLWEQEMQVGSRILRCSTLRELGGAKNISRTHLDLVMKKNLSRGERKIAADVFHYLVTPNGSKIAHSVGDLAYYTRRKQNKVQEVLGRLSASDTRIIRAISQAPDTENVQRFEIFHDVLAPAVLEWRRRFLERRFLVLAEVLIGFGLSTIVLSLLFFIGVELITHGFLGVRNMFFVIEAWFHGLFYDPGL